VVTAIVLCNSHDYIRRNDFTFFGNMVRVEPNSAKARLGYGYALLQAGMMADAEVQLLAGLQIIPDFPRAHHHTRHDENDQGRLQPGMAVIEPRASDRSSARRHTIDGWETVT
jgi:hypothetical protein